MTGIPSGSRASFAGASSSRAPTGRNTSIDVREVHVTTSIAIYCGLSMFVAPIIDQNAECCKGFPQKRIGIPPRKFSHIPTKVEVKSDSCARPEFVS
jgi:hypothetical protein